MSSHNIECFLSLPPSAFHAPKDASVSSVSRDVVHAIRLISPFVSAYKSVSKRRSLPWDPNMGEDAGEMDAYVL